MILILDERISSRISMNEEIAKTNALVNMADDFEIACKIRAMVVAVEEKGTMDAEWIAWAKADWYNSTIAATDEFFGKRNHKESAEQKALRER
ncbi:MAG: hypothetical protein ACI3VU_07935 [Faecousia sp.]